VSVTQVINRISQIRAQLGVTRPTSGYAATAARVGTASAIGGSGVIVGRMGVGTPDLAAVGAQQAALSAAATTRIDNLSPPLPIVDPGSGYGMRTHPIHGDQRMHHGVDLGAETGTPISAISDGIVSFAGERGGYGNLVIIDHGGGYETRYAHQAQLAVTAGDLVRSGDLIGYVGSTGASTGPHLHFEVRRDGESVDPEPWLVH
jgi:murein DD-endopeptidase MepM/ murein hydrolase activator NlpD